MDTSHHDTPNAEYRTDLAATLDNAGLTAERRITEGLVELLADLVLSGSAPGSEEYAAAEAALNSEETP